MQYKAYLVIAGRLLTRLPINSHPPGEVRTHLKLIKIPIANPRIAIIGLHTILKSPGIRTARIRFRILIFIHVARSRSRRSSLLSLSRRGRSTSKHTRQTMANGMSDSDPCSRRDDIGDHAASLRDCRRLGGRGCSGRGCLLGAGGDGRCRAGLLWG
jgi:hypothetical protein